MQQIPKSLSTKAPASRVYSLLTVSLTIVAVRPAFVVELPQTYTPLGATLIKCFSIYDFPRPGSPTTSI